jgi:hypothetical protein
MSASSVPVRNDPTMAHGFYLSRQATGFNGVAIVNTGLQWCGPARVLGQLDSRDGRR